MSERGHLPAPSLDRLVAGSLPAPEMSEAMAHLTRCDACRAARAELEQHKAEFEREVFPRTLPRLSERRRFHASWRSLPPLARFGLALPVAAGAAALLVLAVAPARELEVGIKGGTALRLFAQRGDTVFRVKPGMRLAAGDRIRFVVEPGAGRYLLIAGVDGNGSVSVYFPRQGSGSAEVAALRSGPTGRIEVPGSIELDDAPGPERLYVYLSDHPLAAAAVRRALAGGPERPVLAGERPPLSFSFEKEAR